MGERGNLESLSDFASLAQFRDALWGQNEIRGAAVMVGAGFSRCAIRVSDTSPVPPLWSTFEDAMLARLYPGAKRGYDPLKLAEEFKASLGAHALDALIRQLVADDQWLPSDQHSRLLGLPWADVLTTNWDTLLERTTLPNPDRSYDVVRTMTDIARTRAPRIVKLHGSFPSQQPFIFTSEDFRTYPRNFPAFINLAQQVLLENDLCLVGFSGDDPNFLQWAGWVRDQLGSSARRIRLVGALNLSVSQRQVLEQRNVTPIDLGPLVRGLEPDEAHAVASKIFLDALWEGKPKPRHIWNRIDRYGEVEVGKTSDQIIGDLISWWEADRKAYPGWLVAPSHDRQRLISGYGSWFNELRDHWSKAESELQAKVVSELAWRLETALCPLDDLTRGIFNDAFAGAAIAHISKANRTRLARLLLIDARHGRERDQFAKWLDILEEIGGEEAFAIANYQRALLAKADFDFPKLAELIPLVEGHDPVWRLRQAYLYCSMREYEKAAGVIRDAVAEIHARRLRENKSIYLLSREAWASWLFRSSSWAFDRKQSTLYDDHWPNDYHAIASDPWDHIQAVDSQIAKEWEERTKEAIAKEPKFDAGAYLDHAKTVRLNGNGWRQTCAVDYAVYLAEHVGIPDKIDMVGIFGERIGRALQVMPSVSEPYIFLGAANLHHHSKGLIDHLFGRVSVARLSIPSANDLATKLKAGIEYALAQIAGGKHDWVDQARIYLELLSRLVIIQPPEDAKRTFEWGMELSTDRGMSHWWLSEPFSHLLHRSLEAIPPSLRADLAFESLRLKLPSEHNVQGIEREWPEISDKFAVDDFSSRKGNRAWSIRIDELIEVVRVGDNLNRTRALLRLVPLAESNGLLEGERATLASAIWDRRSDGDGMPADCDLYPHVYLSFPEPAEGLIGKAFKDHIVKPLSQGEVSSLRLAGLQGASRKKARNRVEITSDEALRIFAKCIDWRPPESSTLGHFTREGQEVAAVRELIGSCLVWSVIPELSSGMIDSDQADRWAGALEDRIIPSFLQTAPYLAKLVPSRGAWVTMTLRKALAARDETVVKAALNAIFHFVQLHKEFGVDVPAALCSDVAGMCAVRPEAGLLDTLTVARHLAIAGLLTEDDQLRIVDSLDILLVDLDYQEWDASDRRTNVLSLLRAECVRLALAFQKAGRTEPIISQWIAAKSTDVFPEVRFAEILEHD